MSQSLAKRKAELMQEMDAIADKLLSSAKSPEEISLTEIEEAALELGQRMQAVLTQQWVAASVEAGEKQPPRCATCQAGLRHKGYRERQVVTQCGEVKIRRAYYYCESCKRGIFPPG